MLVVDLNKYCRIRLTMIVDVDENCVDKIIFESIVFFLFLKQTIFTHITASGQN